MNREPIAGLSDQRYFHIALMTPAQGSFDLQWLWRILRRSTEVRQGRWKRSEEEDVDLDFRTILESPGYAGSLATQVSLAVDEDVSQCAFDIFVGKVGALVFFGSGYSALTRTLLFRMMAENLTARVRFLAPRLNELVDFCRRPEDPLDPVKFSVTGFAAFLANVKKVHGLRLSGRDVFASGLLREIERWVEEQDQGLGERTEQTGQRGGGSLPERQSKEAPALRFEALRLKAVGSLSAKTASLTVSGRGGVKIWLQKGAGNLGLFGEAVEFLRSSRLFDVSTNPPDWFEDQSL